ncbi:MAG: DNA-binding protein WhiA [Clostridiaceae bacterium]|jgi:DNA-binding protein WhiA|nr:DNA-binding protein WhiA [Clostridiaceae bacterium]
MSFSMEIKSELTRMESTDICCKKYELAGIIRAGIAVNKYKGNPRLLFITENASLSRHLFSRVKELYKNSPDIFMLKTRRFRTHTVYRLEFTHLLADEMTAVLKNMGISLTENYEKLSYENIDIMNRCCKRAYLRGCFMATGSISDPDRFYHLEITFPNLLLATEYIDLLKEFDVESRHIVRKGHYLVYLKEGQEIVDFLNVIGAHNALMKLENIRIMKEMRNQVNRIVNCETANLEKTVNASVRQVDSIKFIAETNGLESLPENLREIASLRLENPSVSLAELGQMLTPVLSKSGVNHRLKKIDSIAENMRLNKN